MKTNFFPFLLFIFLLGACDKMMKLSLKMRMKISSHQL